MSLLNELKRRKVFRVAIGYVVAAWIFAQVADLIAHNFFAPAWVMQMIITLLIVGLPVSLLLSWAFELTADGIRRTTFGEIEGSLVVSSKAILVMVAGLFIGMAAVFYVAWPRGDRSIAVLPFEDISPDRDQAYLGNGIADELRLELQHLDGLRVAGRTSSIAYAKEDSKTIGDVLNVETILEGSVRKEGDTVRITVQLTYAADGYAIWSESYNRKLDKIFEMQEDIASSVAGALGVRLGVGGINDFRGAGTQNVEAYEAYLKAMSHDYSRSGQEVAIPLLERALELDPNYAVAWSMLATRVGTELWEATPDEVPAITNRAVELGRRGVQLDAESAAANAVLGILQMLQFDWVGAEQSFRRATTLLADRANVSRYAFMLMRSGRLADAQKQFDIATALEPMDGRPVNLSWHASLSQGRIDEAKARRYFNPGEDLFEDKLDIAFNEQDPEALKAAIQGLPETNLSYIHLYGPMLTEFDSPERVFALLETVYRDKSLQWPRKIHDIAMAAVYFGDPELALKIKAEDIRANPSRLVAIWYPVMSAVRRLPDFKEFVADLNLVEYWRAYGWPEACAPLGDDDFTCT